MKKSLYILISLLAMLVGMLAVGSTLYALDEPHDSAGGSGISVACSSCHFAQGATPTWATQPLNAGDTTLNNLCMLKCHNSTYLSGLYASPKTHSYITTSSKYTAGNQSGLWVMECRTCHNPHYQRQSRINPSGGFLVTGITSSLGATTLTDMTKTWTTDELQGGLLVPDINYPYYVYRIINNTGNTITVAANPAFDNRYVNVGSTYGIKYGKMIKDVIKTPFNGSKQVNFNDNGSFADGNAGNGIDGVCEVCHNMTRNPNTLASRYQSTGNAESPLHNPGANCTQTCHLHSNGFKDPGGVPCDTCHGQPPTTSSLGGPNGLANTSGGTGVGTPGAHQRHALSLGIQCLTCHTSAMPATAVPDYKIEIGFNAFGTTGNYDGRSTLSGTFQYLATNGTILTQTGLMRCSNIYCHSNGVGTFTTPRWGVSTSGACGTCHGVNAASTTISSPRHAKHVMSASGYKYACSKCHSTVASVTTDATTTPSVISNSQHVNKSKTVAWDAYNSDATAYTSPTCDTLYCHSDGTIISPPASPNQTADWGVSFSNCIGCHKGGNASGDPMATGSHTKHVVDSLQDCSKCHSQTATNSTTINVATGFAKHVNKSVEISYDAVSNPNSNATYSGLVSAMSKSVGTPYASCTNLYCHGSGTPTWGGASLLCNDCHNANNTLAGKHAIHYGASANAVSKLAFTSDTTAGSYVFNCGACHDSAPHADGAVSTVRAAQVVFDAVVAGGGSYSAGATTGGAADRGFNWTAGAANNSCASTYCHSQGTTTVSASYLAPKTTSFQWSAASTLTCGGCHGNTSATLTTGKHTKHIQTYAYACSNCHFATTTNSTSIADRTKHVTNKKKDVAFNVFSIASGTYNNGTLECSNTYCHSNGTTTVAPTHAAFAWTATTSCTSCHAGDASQVSKMSSGTHTAHINNTAVLVTNYTCDTCHSTSVTGNTTINPATGYANHVNGTKTVVMSATYGGTWASPTCSTSKCHGTTSPTWGASTSSIDPCTKCHGTPTVGAMGSSGAAMAPPKDTAGNVATANKGVGTHQSHLLGTHNYSSPVTCSTCHIVPTNANSAGHIDSALPAEITFSGLALVNPRTVAGTPTYNTGTYQCSNVYCHDYQRFKNGYADDSTAPAANRTPTWNATLLVGNNVSDCNQCHGYPPAGSHPQQTDCSTCHSHVSTVNNISFNDDTKHVNGTVEGGQCFSCHEAGANVISGAHAKHYDTAGGNTSGRNFGDSSTSTYYKFECGTCHDPVLGSHPTGNVGDYLADVKMNITWATGYQTTGTYSAGTFSVTDAKGLKISQNGKCNNVYCHSSGIAPGAGSPTYVSNVDWSVSTTCSSCHASTPATNNHVKHASTTTGYGFGCVECHQATVSSNTVIGDESKHANFINDVAWKTNGWNTNGSLYEASGVETCTNIYCHSTGVATVAPYSTPLTTATWSNATMGCAGCHGNSTATLVTGKHTKHMTSYTFTCNNCHFATTTNNTTISDKTMHVNKNKDLSFNVFTITSGTYNNGTQQCSNTYCHSNGTTTVAPTHAAFAWTVTTSCTSCHAGDASQASKMSSGTHTAHTNNAAVLGTNYTCDACHTTTVNGNTTINPGTGYTNHVNGTKTVAINVAYGGTWASPTCSTSECHGTKSPNWGSSTASIDPCTKCHGTPTVGAMGSSGYKIAPPNDTNGNTLNTDKEVGAHLSHLTATHNYSAPVACNTCHIVPTNANSVGHIDSLLPAEITFSGTALINPRTVVGTPTYSSATSQCSNVYCHDRNRFKNGYADDSTAPAYNPTPTWNSPMMVGNVNDCNMCHGYPPGGSHVQGNPSCSTCHSDVSSVNQISFVTPTMHINGNVEGSGGACNSCHGYPPAKGDGKLAMLINGITPTVLEGKSEFGHLKHVRHLASLNSITTNPGSDAFGAGNVLILCGTCHDMTGSNHSMDGNGTRNINFNASTTYQFGGAAPKYNGSVGVSSSTKLKSCSNVSCHFQDSPGWTNPAQAGN